MLKRYTVQESPGVVSFQRADIRLLYAPHIPHEQGSIRSKLLADLLHLFLAHVLPLPALVLQLRDVAAHERRHAPLNTEIAEAEDVEALEREASKHLDAPATKPPHRDELLQDLLVRRRGEHSRGELARGEFLGQAGYVLRLALGEAGRAQRLERHGSDLGRVREALAGASTEGYGRGFVATVFLEQGNEPLLDGRGRRAADLLADDAAGQALEGINLLCQPLGGEDAAVVLLDQRAHALVDLDEMRARFFQYVGSRDPVGRQLRRREIHEGLGRYDAGGLGGEQRRVRRVGVCQPGDRLGSRLRGRRSIGMALGDEPDRVGGGGGRRRRSGLRCSCSSPWWSRRHHRLRRFGRSCCRCFALP